MLRALPLRLVFLAGEVMLGMMISTGAVMACTAADMTFATRHDDDGADRAGVVKMSSTSHDSNLNPRFDPRVTMAPGEGLKLRTRQQDTVLSAALTERPTASASPSRSSSTLPVQVAPDSAAEHGGKPLAMLVAALVLMVSIALRRSGKR